MNRVAPERIFVASLVVALPILLAACSQDEASHAAHTAAPEKVQSVSSKLSAAPLTGEEITSAQLSGDLACTFSSDSSKTYILYASGLVGSTEPSHGIVKLNGEIKQVSAPSGFNGMISGAAFIGHDLDVIVTPTGKATGGGESPPVPAKILIVNDDSESLSIQGLWQCGP